MSTKAAKPTKTAPKAAPAKPVSKVITKPTESKPVTKSIRLSEEDKKADTANYIYNPNTKKYVKRDTPFGKRLVKAEENGEEVPQTMTETGRLILVVQTIVDHGVEDSFIKEALKSIEEHLPRGFPVAWGGKQKSVRSPDHPKQPSNAYIFYTKAVRQSVVEANPDLSNTEIVSLMAKMWTETSEEDRSEYKESARLDKERYVREMEVFEREHPELARTKYSPGKPTKVTAYRLFCETNRAALKEEQPDLDGKTITQLIADQWEDVKKDPKEVAKYQALADKANEDFEERIIEYHESNSPKKLSEVEQRKANDPDNYELNPKTGFYVEKKKAKKAKEPEPEPEVKAKTATKKAATKKAAPKTVAESVINDEIESADDDAVLVGKTDDNDVLLG